MRLLARICADGKIIFVLCDALCEMRVELLL